MRDRFPVLVSLSLLVGRLSLVLLRWSGLPDTAHREARTLPQRAAFKLGTCAQRMNEIGFSRQDKAERLGLPA